MGEGQDVNTQGVAAMRAMAGHIEEALATISGQPTGIRHTADFERVVMSMADVSPSSVTSVSTTRVPGSADTMQMSIRGMSREDADIFAANLNATYGEGTAVIAAREGQDGARATVIRIPIARMESIIAGAGTALSMHDHVECMAQTPEGADLIRSLQPRTAVPFRGPVEEVATGTTTPAAPVRPGTVLGHGNGGGLHISDSRPGRGLGTDNAVEQIRGLVEFNVVQGANGRLQAQVNGQPNMIVVRDTITATLEGVNGAPPRQVQLQADNVGNLTEVPAQAAPQGRGQQNTEPQR
jgi:hypothetical protein